MSEKNVKYEKIMPLEAIHRITGLMQLRLVTKITLKENHGFWDVEVVER